MLLILDNHDSFTHNLAELLRSIGHHDYAVTSSSDFLISDLTRYSHVIFSPGPGLPGEQPAMFEILSELERMSDTTGINKSHLPSVLGICLGMQAIALHFGGSLFNLPEVVHGQPRNLMILNPGHPLFRSVHEGTEVGLYHSWAVDPATLPAALEPLAVSNDGTLMAIAHKTLPAAGVQFHPESHMTKTGREMIQTWIRSGQVH